MVIPHRVQLVGRAHRDAQDIIRKSDAGVSPEDYIAMSDGTICSVNRNIIGYLPEPIKPIKKVRTSAKKVQLTPHDYHRKVLRDNG